MGHVCAIAADDTITCWGDNEHGQADAPAGAHKTITTGGRYSCAIAANGTITCWGQDFGQLDAPAGTYETVSAGALHSCAIATDGAITCWGDNEHGQLDAPAGAHRAVSAGAGYSCATAVDGALTCWGDNSSGLADAPAGSYKSVSAGVRHSCAIATSDTLTCWGHYIFILADAPAGTYRTVSAGAYHNCAVATDDTLMCWGDNKNGQLHVPAGAYRTVSVGVLHNCAIAVDGAITCWGDNSYGEADAPAGTYKSVSAGALHSCAIAADDAITCWGYNQYGQLDAPAGSYRAVSAGVWHSCALAVDGAITCWGNNNLGQTDAPGGTYRAVSVGEAHGCAIAADGTVTCWGDNSYGQSDAPAGTYKAVAAGSGHGCAIAADDAITCWGGAELGIDDVPAGTYRTLSADVFHTCAIAADGTITCWGPVPPPADIHWVTVPPGPEPEPAAEPGLGAGGDGGLARPGEGVEVMAGRADWYNGYFQAALYKQLLEELGYSVSDPAQGEMGPGDAYAAMALGVIDYWPNSWYPGHLVYLDRGLPDGSLVGDHVSIVGEELIAGAAQGFLVTKSFADAYGVYTMDDLNNDAQALAAFDASDHVPGNGKAEIFGCPESWTCDDIIENQIAFSGWDNIVQIVGGYDAHFALALEMANNGVPMVVYTWTPSRYITRLRPGDNVYWMGVENVLDDSNPTGVQHGHEHDQRGPDGTGGFAAIGPDQCPSAASRPDGKCPIGWLASDILVTANTAFLEANPAAKALFEAVKLTVVEVSLATEAQRTDGADPDKLAAQWIADNRDRVDSWLAAARAAE